MHAPLPFEKIPDVWIKLWIALGVFAIIVMIGFMILFQAIQQAEYARYSDCVSRTQTACKPSIFWLLNGWSVTGTSAEPTPSDIIKLLPPFLNVTSKTEYTSSSGSLPTAKQILKREK